jgi:hypothetical protein
MQAQYLVETQLLHRVAGNPDCWFRWTDHALQRMGEYGRTADDVIAALTNGHVVRIDVKEDLFFGFVAKILMERLLRWQRPCWSGLSQSRS